MSVVVITAYCLLTIYFAEEKGFVTKCRCSNFKFFLDLQKEKLHDDFLKEEQTIRSKTKKKNNLQHQQNYVLPRQFFEKFWTFNFSVSIDLTLI